MFAIGAQAVTQYWPDHDWLISGGAGFGYWWFCCDSMTDDPDDRGVSVTLPVEASLRFMPGRVGAGLTAMFSVHLHSTDHR